MPHPGSSRVLSLVAAAALALSGCGARADNPHDSPSKAGPLIVDGTVDLAALQQLVDAQQGRSSERQEAELARLDNVLERQLWTESGLEAALGGSAKADAAFAAHGQALTGKARAIGDRPIVISPAAHVADSARPGIGEGLFGGILTVILTTDHAVSASNDLEVGQKISADTAKELGVSGSLEHVDLSFAATHESDGVTTKLLVKVGIAPCPDANGHFEGTAKIDISATTTGGGTGQRGTLDVAVSGEVDEDANLATTDSEYRMQWADFANSKGSFVDVSGAVGGTKARAATLDRSGGKPDGVLQQNAVALGSLYSMMATAKVTEAAQKAWQSGRCVTLEPTAAPGPKSLEPGATSTITAAPRSKLDGGPVGGTVTAKLTAGGASVKPDGAKVKADATFTYTAPDAPDKTGTVSLEARSRRGVAKASIDFDTKQGAYVASGGNPVKVSGTVTDLTAPFTLQGRGPGFTVVFSYSPTNGTSGTFTYAGSGGGVSMKGAGKYQITGSDPVLTLKQTAHGCVNVGGCRTTTDVLTLTRSSG